MPDYQHDLLFGISVPPTARDHEALNTMTMRQNYWTLGAFCAAYCRVVSVHHAIEDSQLFPDLKTADQSLAPVIARLQHEHEGIAKVLAEIDAGLVAMVEDEEHLNDALAAVEREGRHAEHDLTQSPDGLPEAPGRR